MGAASAARDEGGVGRAPAAAPAAAMTNAPLQRNATPSWRQRQRAKHPVRAALLPRVCCDDALLIRRGGFCTELTDARGAASVQEAAQDDASATDDIAKLTSRTLQRTFKALVLLALLATAAVGAGIAFKLGACAHARVAASLRRSVAPSLRRSVAHALRVRALTRPRVCARVRVQGVMRRRARFG